MTRTAAAWLAALLLAAACGPGPLPSFADPPPPPDAGDDDAGTPDASE